MTIDQKNRLHGLLGEWFDSLEKNPIGEAESASIRFDAYTDGSTDEETDVVLLDFAVARERLDLI